MKAVLTRPFFYVVLMWAVAGWLLASGLQLGRIDARAGRVLIFNAALMFTWAGYLMWLSWPTAPLKRMCIYCGRREQLTSYAKKFPAPPNLQRHWFPRRGVPEVWLCEYHVTLHARLTLRTAPQEVREYYAKKWLGELGEYDATMKKLLPGEGTE